MEFVCVDAIIVLQGLWKIYKECMINIGWISICNKNL